MDRSQDGTASSEIQREYATLYEREESSSQSKIYESARKEFDRLCTYLYRPSTSPIAVALVIAPKATHPFIRFCGNYPGINAYLDNIPYPIPHVEYEITRVHLSVSTILAITWPASYPDGIYTLGLAYHTPYELPVYIWLYCIVWWFIQDAAKVFSYKALKHCNLFGINNNGMVVLSQKVLDLQAQQISLSHFQ